MTSVPNRRGIAAGPGATTAATTASDVKQDATSVAPDDSTAHQLLRALAARQVSARELTDAAIARIEALDPKINAVVARDFDRARAAADAADVARSRNEHQPLLGLPMTVKEQFNIAGLPTTWGYERYRDWRPDSDALAVQRLKAAGAIILGKTNVPTGLNDWQSFNDVYGSTNNPWDLGRSPGGSSGGAAAALAAGLVPLELGSDIGGSLRAPAHFCGVFAHKPSIELIPRRGSGPPDTPVIPTRGELAVIGPMARSAADLTLALQVLAGPDNLWDGIGYRLDLPPPRHETLSDYRVLLVDEHPLCPTADSVRAALENLSGNLTRAGCTVSRGSSAMPDMVHTTLNYVALLSSFTAADLKPEERARYEAATSALSPENLSLDAAWTRGATMTHAAWVLAARIREGLRARWQALFHAFDVVLCPAMPTPAFKHDRSPPLTRRIDIDGKQEPYGNQIAWAAVATSAGLPATVAPIGHSETGLPIGVQIIGGYLQDRTTIGFAELIEQKVGGFMPPPRL